MTTALDPGQSARLVFVAGLHRSGTTPVARLLADHPEISGFHDTGAKEDEGQHLQDVYPPARSFGGAGRFARHPLSHVTEESPLATVGNARRLLEQWSPYWDLDRPLLLEKSPPNLLMTRFLQGLYPEARFVVVVRHPVVVALSTRKWSGPVTGLGSLLEHWLAAHETFLEDARHLRNVHVVRYEELVTRPVEVLDGVARFLALSTPIDAGALEGHRSDGYVAAWSSLTESASPVHRWRVRRLRKRFATRIGGFGYDFEDLGRVGRFPEPNRLAPVPRDRVKVLYVGGMPRSGSTLTDLVLHQLPGHVGVGELFYLWRNGLAHDGLCACGAGFTRCPFWTEVGRVAFGGWERVDLERMLRLQDRVDRTARVPLLLSPYRPRRFAAELAEYTAMLQRLYDAVAAVSGEEVVVDSSKRPSLAYVLREMPGVDLSVVHVVRDPRGVAFSFAKHVALPQGAALGDEMPRSSARKVSRRWVSVNAMIAGMRHLGVPVTRVRYEDLVRHPDRELRRVMRLTSRPASAGTFDHLATEGITVPRTHVVAGGRIRLVDGTLPLRLDEQWRWDMPVRSRRLVEVLTAPVRWMYGYQ